jgi:N-methylhydantoinase A
VRAYSFARREPAVFGVVDRLALADGDTVQGPSIVLEPTATTYIDAGFEGRVLAGGVLELVVEAGA